MGFLNPIAFWGLLALIVPTIILFLSKQKQQVVEFGSLAFLETSESKTARKLFPTEWLLCLLRVAMICLVVLFLAEPVMISTKIDKRMLIEKEVYEDPSFGQVLETLGDDVEIIEPQSLSVLIRKLNENADSVVVYSRSYTKDFKGSISELGKHVDWRIVPNATEFQLRETVTLGENQLQLTLLSGENGIRWESDPLQNTLQIAAEPISINLLSSTDRSVEKVQLQNILKAYEQVIPVSFVFENEAPAWTILIDTLVDTTFRNVISWNDFDGRMELSSLSSNVFELKGKLSLDHLSASNFPLEFAHVLLQEKFDLKELDRRIYTPVQSSEALRVLKANVQRDKVQYWWILIMLLVLLERWLNQKSANT